MGLEIICRSQIAFWSRPRIIYRSIDMDEMVKTMLVVAAMAIPCIILAIAIIAKF